MIELTKIQKTYKLDLLLTKYINPIQNEDFSNNIEFNKQLKNIKSYINSRLIIDKNVKQRYNYLQEYNLECDDFYDKQILGKNVLEIYIHVKFCKYYKKLILKDWFNHELLLDCLIQKYKY